MLFRSFLSEINFWTGKRWRCIILDLTVSLFASNVLDAIKKGDHYKNRFIPSIGQDISLSTRYKPASIAMVGKASNQLTQIFRGRCRIATSSAARTASSHDLSHLFEEVRLASQ